MSAPQIARFESAKHPLTGKPLIPYLQFIEVVKPYSKMPFGKLLLDEAYEKLKEGIPSEEERETKEAIISRLVEVNTRAIKEAKYDGHNFHLVLVRDKETEKIVGYFQWSYMGSGNCNANYGQYVVVDPDFQQKGIWSVLKSMAYLVSKDDAEKVGKNISNAVLVGECEFPGQASNKQGILQTFNRVENVHYKGDFRAIMIEFYPSKMYPGLAEMLSTIGETSVWSGQPPLRVTTNICELLIMLQYADPKRNNRDVREPIDNSFVIDIHKGLMSNFRTESFDQIMQSPERCNMYFSPLGMTLTNVEMNGVALAETIILDRLTRGQTYLVPLPGLKYVTEYAKIDPVLAIQCKADFGDLAAHAEFIAKVDSQRRAGRG